MDKHKIELTNSELKILEQLLIFSLWEIQKQFKKLNSYDYDLKEHYWNYRKTCNEIREKITNISNNHNT